MSHLVSVPQIIDMMRMRMRNGTYTIIQKFLIFVLFQSHFEFNGIYWSFPMLIGSSALLSQQCFDPEAL